MNHIANVSSGSDGSPLKSMIHPGLHTSAKWPSCSRISRWQSAS